MASTTTSSLRAILAALGSFVLGAVVVPLYDRLTYDGFSISQPHDVVTTNSQGELQIASYGTVLKIANATKSSLIIDSIISEDAHFHEMKLAFVGTRVRVADKGIQIPIPIALGNAEAADSGFPLLVKPDSIALVQIELIYRPVNGPLKNVTDQFTERYKAVGIPVNVKINGKFRSYTLLTRQPNENRVPKP